MLQPTGAVNRWVVRHASGLDWYASQALHGNAPLQLSMGVRERLSVAGRRKPFHSTSIVASIRLLVIVGLACACVRSPSRPNASEPVGCVLPPLTSAEPTTRWQARELVRRSDGPAGEVRGLVLAFRDSGHVTGPLEGVVIRRAGTSQGAISRADGTFTLLAQPQEVITLEVRRIGYEAWIGSVDLRHPEGVYLEMALPPITTGPSVIADERVCPLVPDSGGMAPRRDAP